MSVSRRPAVSRTPVPSRRRLTGQCAAGQSRRMHAPCGRGPFARVAAGRARAVRMGRADAVGVGCARTVYLGRARIRPSAPG
jgi:hypothetical protein